MKILIEQVPIRDPKSGVIFRAKIESSPTCYGESKEEAFLNLAQAVKEGLDKAFEELQPGVQVE